MATRKASAPNLEGYLPNFLEQIERIIVAANLSVTFFRRPVKFCFWQAFDSSIQEHSTVDQRGSGFVLVEIVHQVLCSVFVMYDIRLAGVCMAVFPKTNL